MAVQKSGVIRCFSLVVVTTMSTVSSDRGPMWKDREPTSSMALGPKCARQLRMAPSTAALRSASRLASVEACRGLASPEK